MLVFGILKQSYGISLIEALASISVISILLVAGHLKGSSIAEIAALKRDSQKLASELEKILFHSQVLEEDFTVNFGNSSWTVFPSKSNNGKSYSYNLTNGNSFSKLPISSKIVIYKSGVTTPAHIEIKSNNKTCTITNSLRGRITLIC